MQKRSSLGVSSLSPRRLDDGGNLLEAQIAADGSRCFLILEASDLSVAEQVVRQSGFPAHVAKPVRLVGQDLEPVCNRQLEVDFVVEWDFPLGLTMEAYLARKRANAPRYALVPEAKFLRTYVCEDMSKCLCFYDADSSEDVLKARRIVEAPVDRITRVDASLGHPPESWEAST